MAMHAMPQTLFLSTGDIIAIVRRRGLPVCLAAMAARIEHDFSRWSQFAKTPRIANHSRDGVIELMPISDADTYAFKYVNGHPRNTQFGLPTVMAFGVLADVATGMPTLLSELTLTTAIRTAATSAMVARHLARPESRTMAIIGNGAQAEFQALAFHHLLGIEKVQLFDTDRAASDKLARNLRAASTLSIEICASARSAVIGADIVTTLTADKTNATILTADMLEPGMHVNAVGGDCPGKTELAADVLRAGRVFVEYEPQTRIEGDLQQMPADFAVTEFWRALAGEASGRRDAQEVTVFDSVGFAIEDFSALHVMGEAARDLGIGQTIDLIAASADPKDLFGLLGLDALSLQSGGRQEAA
jgi:ornithine cyclodeaminase